MTRIAILGGGIAGLSAAYELEKARTQGAALDWHLYEASDRLGGIVETTRRSTPEGEYILEGGPDGWVTEKPWARELAEELGLGADVIPCKEADRKTYVLLDGSLVPMPERMRMMVPEDPATLHGSPLFSADAIAAYEAEPGRAAELQANAPQQDESVASFVRRHFGDEVLQKVGAPLLSGVFGGDVDKLSVQAVMFPFVKMESEHGSLIVALQHNKRERGGKPAQPTFTSLRRGMGSLAEALAAALPPERLHLGRRAKSLKRERGLWCVRTETKLPKGRTGVSKRHFDHVLLAAPVDAARALLEPLDREASELIPHDASSSVLVCFCWGAEATATFSIPPGFGFLVPNTSQRDTNVPHLLAGTFVDQKFPDRAPAGARVLRAFFGGHAADTLSPRSDTVIAAEALQALQAILPGLPDPDRTLTTVRRWPRSLPQYEVCHTERMADLERRIASLGGIDLLGNGYRGVGVPDLIRDARAAARKLTASLPKG